MDHTSEDLLVLVAGGDKHAFGEFYDRTSARVMGVCMHVLHNQAVAEEVTQEVFIEAWRTAASFSPHKGSAVGWILRLARSRAIDKLRSRMSEIARDERDAMLDSLTRYVSVEDEALSTIEGAHVRSAVEHMGEPHRSAILLTYFGGLTQQQLADHLDIPLGTAKTRIRDGLKKLRTVLSTTLGKEDS